MINTKQLSLLTKNKPEILKTKRNEASFFDIYNNFKKVDTWLKRIQINNNLDTKLTPKNSNKGPISRIDL